MQSTVCWLLTCLCDGKLKTLIGASLSDHFQVAIFTSNVERGFTIHVATFLKFFLTTIQAEKSLFPLLQA